MPQVPDTSVELPPIDQPSINGNRSEPQPWRPRLWQRKRPLTICGIASFIIGLPLVSVEDGLGLSIFGLVLELLACICLILIVFALIDEGR